MPSKRYLLPTKRYLLPRAQKISEPLCNSGLVQNAELTAAAKSVPGIEVVETIPTGARKIAGPFRPHQGPLLKETLESMTEREDLVTGPDARGFFNIHRKAKA